MTFTFLCPFFCSKPRDSLKKVAGVRATPTPVPANLGEFWGVANHGSELCAQPNKLTCNGAANESLIQYEGTLHLASTASLRFQSVNMYIELCTVFCCISILTILLCWISQIPTCSKRELTPQRGILKD